MREPLVIAAVQPLCLPYDVEANSATHAATIRSARARVVVFPELSLTGYHLDAPLITEHDPRLSPIVEACAELDSIALVGVPLKGEQGRAHIAILAVDGAGAGVAYRKLWVDETEADRFTPGEKPAALDVDGWRLGLGICKDTKIAQHASDTAALGIDAYLAGTVMFPHQGAEQDERAGRIATTHRVWVAFASFAGATGEGYTETVGCSGIWTPEGVLLEQVGPEPGGIARGTLG
jgi:predicted amidohydrolase